MFKNIKHKLTLFQAVAIASAVLLLALFVFALVMIISAAAQPTKQISKSFNFGHAVEIQLQYESGDELTSNKLQVNFTDVVPGSAMIYEISADQASGVFVAAESEVSPLILRASYTIKATYMDENIYVPFDDDYINSWNNDEEIKNQLIIFKQNWENGFIPFESGSWTKIMADKNEDEIDETYYYFNSVVENEDIAGGEDRIQIFDPMYLDARIGNAIVGFQFEIEIKIESVQAAHVLDIKGWAEDVAVNNSLYRSWEEWNATV